MKLLALLVLASAVLALPSPNANPEPWCLRVAMPCWKTKRAVDAFTRSLDESSSIAARSEPPAVGTDTFASGPGSPGFFAEQALNELAHISALSSGKPVTFYTDLPISFSTDVDFHNGKDQDAKEATKRSEPEKRWCLRVAMPCWKAKRAAEAVLEAANEEAEADTDSISKREASPCMQPGQACWQAKRDLYAMKAVARDILDQYK